MRTRSDSSALLLDPNRYHPEHFDAETRRLLRATIVGAEEIFATFLTPARDAAGNPYKRWDTARIAAMSEVLGFYGINYWYPWQGPAQLHRGAADVGGLRGAQAGYRRRGVRARLAAGPRSERQIRNETLTGRQRSL